MKWIVKAAAQRVLGSMPREVADPIYHEIQRRLRSPAIDVPGQRSFILEAAEFLKVHRGKSLTGLQIVELGSGWFPVLPLLLVREFGVSAVHTFDVNHHYSPARISAAARTILEITTNMKGDPVLERVARTGELPQSIHYYPRTRIQNYAEVRGDFADVAFSRLVLEYISPQEIRDIHAQSHQWLRPDAFWFHLLRTSDDRALKDKTLNRFDFLRYSQNEWTRICGNRFAYKNRLRLPQYRSLFQSAGWRVKGEHASTPKSDLATLHRVPLHPDFSEFSAEELIASSIRFALVSDGRTLKGTRSENSKPQDSY